LISFRKYVLSIHADLRSRISAQHIINKCKESGVIMNSLYYIDLKRNG